MAEQQDQPQSNTNSTTRKFEWDAPNKVLTGTFQALERVALTTTNLVVIEDGVFTLKPMVTQIRVENSSGEEKTTIYLDENWADRLYLKTGADGQDGRVEKIVKAYIDKMKGKGITFPNPNKMFGGVNDPNVIPTDPSVIPAGGDAENNLMFGGGIGNLDLSSSIRNTKNIGVKYHKGKTEKCVEQCIRRNSSSRRTRRRPKPKAKQHK